MRSRYETGFAVYTVVAALIHFAGETYYHVKWGQPFLGYLVDLIAISLLIIAGVASLRIKPGTAAGWLAAGWGFTFCLAYRSFAWRHQTAATDRAEPAIILNILGGTLIVAALAFVIAFWMARPRKA